MNRLQLKRKEKERIYLCNVDVLSSRIIIFYALIGLGLSEIKVNMLFYLKNTFYGGNIQITDFEIKSKEIYLKCESCMRILQTYENLDI